MSTIKGKTYKQTTGREAGRRVRVSTSPVLAGSARAHLAGVDPSRPRAADHIGRVTARRSFVTVETIEHPTRTNMVGRVHRVSLGTLATKYTRG